MITPTPKAPLFKVVLDYIIYLNLIVATSASTLSAGVANVLGTNNYLEYGLFSFFATFCVYNGQRLFKINKETTSLRLKWVLLHRNLVFTLSITSGILASYLFTQLMTSINLIVIILMFIGGLLSLLYVVRIGKKNLRERSYIKTHSIAFTWTLVALLFPAINENISDFELFLYFIPAHYLYFLAVAASFDINDLRVDPPTQRTIPQIVGYHHTKKVSITLLIFSTIGITYYLFTPFVLIAILTQVLLIKQITDESGDIYFNVLIDGAISLLGISYLVI